MPRPYADVVQGKIRELRIRFGSNFYRFLYFFFGKKIIITHGFSKKTDNIPQREIVRAERLMQDFLERYQGGEIKL
ncbi:MAG: type II toxin-antitoxin system RelE/ParE family toxin [Candidatus Omnitrophica bacterium]|nr:type II toxin-antitoxin system RelE/ParE family toxin [Candidatus Omnitrophota bacterium]